MATAPHDQKLLRTLLKRAGYETSELASASGPDAAREQRLILRIQDGMVMRDSYLSGDRDDHPQSAAALSRWENEGGTASVVRPAAAEAEVDDEEAQ
ncbi:hypothetical protein ACLE20_00035 [Rhizobium sp. YIM 134829]|uniref:hypothetical protein n=1 Tax=Rhizobium sp. YIM 134829 TaxID=3390453 RepID=UPI003978C4C3